MRGFSAALLVILLMGCGDDDDGGGTIDGAVTDGPGTADAPVPDASLPDASLPDAAPPFAIGMPCPTGTECLPGLLCLDEGEGWPGEGFCTLTCTSNMDCDTGAYCSPDLGGARICLPTCAASDCASIPGRVCETHLGGFFDLGQPTCLPGDATKTDGDACAGFFSCNAEQGCISNPFSMPGGMCVTVGCTVGDDTTCAPGGDGMCLPNGGSSLCLDQCATDTDCRMAEGYACVNLAAGVNVCFYPTVGVGAACAAPTDCGPAPWECLTGSGFPGGYCGADGCDPANDQTCPFESTCYDPTPGSLDGTEFCAKNCGSNAECRMGYQCLPSGAGGMVCR